MTGATGMRMAAFSVLSLAIAACEPEASDRRLVGLMQSDRIEISAEFPEPIVERAVVEGERVTTGQLLIRQDTSRIDARIAEAEAALGQASARLDELVRGPRKEQIAAIRASVEGAVNELEFRETDLARAQRDTFDYLVSLRRSVADFLEAGGDISDISSVKQTEFSYLLNFQEIAGRNAQQVFTEMEWE